MNGVLKFDVSVEDKDLTPRYCSVTLSGVTVAASPDWIQSKLKAIGLVPVNNIVDITNYVLHELGQPLHAFDADKIKGRKIQVKTLAQGTNFTTLDGVERELHAEDLMICDGDSNPLCLAGVFGRRRFSSFSVYNIYIFRKCLFQPCVSSKVCKKTCTEYRCFFSI